MRLPLAPSLFLLTLTACPGDDGSSDDAPTSGSSGSSTAAVDSTSDSATSLGTTTDSVTGDATGSDSSSDDGTASCPPFADETSPSPITIDIVNNRPEGVWLPMDADCLESVPWQLTDANGDGVPWRGPSCGTCEGSVQGSCPCPPPFCDELTGLYLEAGASVQYMWSGLTYATHTVPRACPGINDCGETCEQAVVPAAGGYTVTIQAGRAMGCAVEPCDCMPSDGSCTLYDAGMTFSSLTEHGGTLNLPGDSWVVISIE